LPSAKVTLTFDNGPEPEVTPEVLECLARHKIRATFFVMGRKAATPDGAALIRRALAQAHWIGNHTFTHSAPLGRVAPETALREFDQAEHTLAWIDQPRRLFRPPGSGELGHHLLQPVIVDKLIAGSYTCVLWNSAPGDWHDPDGWVDRAVADCRSRDWTLMALHDKPNGAMRHLDDFLSRLENEGFQFIQEFPPDCMPIVGGKVELPLEPYLTV
jgi:peptidoglycan-N-acetylglucosamine deacetylase